MSNLLERAREIESKLNDCGATLVEASLAAIRALYEDNPSECSGGALVAATVLAEVVLEQLDKGREPYVRDGDIQVGFASLGPGKQVEAFIAKLRTAEKAATVERRKTFAPLVGCALQAAGLGGVQ